jgi:hypothetical protein
VAAPAEGAEGSVGLVPRSLAPRVVNEGPKRGEISVPKITTPRLPSVRRSLLQQTHSSDSGACTWIQNILSGIGLL